MNIIIKTRSDPSDETTQIVGFLIEPISMEHKYITAVDDEEEKEILGCQMQDFHTFFYEKSEILDEKFVNHEQVNILDVKTGVY